MAIVVLPESSLRRDGAESSRLLWAFAVSLMLHLFFFSAWYGGQRFGWWQNLHLPAWLQSPKMLTAILKQPVVTSPQQPQEIPLEFVEVSPAQATAEAPKNTKYYSTQNSLAANPDASVDSDVPKIEGKQTQVVRTEDVPREHFTPLQPVAPPEKSKPPVEEPKPPELELKPKPSPGPGDLALAQPERTPHQEQGQETYSRPRTISEALARQQPIKHLAGEKMKQEGGVRRHLEISSVDAKGSPLGFYDYALVQAVQKCWFDLLDDQSYASDYRGKVELHFRLHHDGSISDLLVVGNTAGPIAGLICETAVDKPKPYEKFPADMRRMVGDVRNIIFTFFYN